MYNINWYSTLWLLLPVFLRKSKMFEFLKCGFKQVKLLYDNFIQYRQDCLATLGYSSKIADLEYLLNSQFNGGGMEIYIATNDVKTLYCYLYNDSRAAWILYTYNEYLAQTNPAWIYLPLYPEDAFDTTFTVYVPTSLVFDHSKMTALINKYKLTGKNFNIVSY